MAGAPGAFCARTGTLALLRILLRWRSPTIIVTTFFAGVPSLVWSVIETSTLTFTGRAGDSGAAFAGAASLLASTGFAGCFAGAAGFVCPAYAEAASATPHITIATLFSIGSSVPPIRRCQRCNLHLGNRVQWTHGDRLGCDGALADRRDFDWR